jgi:Na+-transporting methylmalonyl-CoA/oxaloacetate decarboxylase gamma subunit
MAAIASSVPVLIAGALTDVAGVTFVMALLSLTIAVVAYTTLTGRGGARVEPVAVGR